mmetsp:Transcript_88637/g.247997  ORF Transcript_88637/g.247997 Transcript_88637/m.247997 type:complete len:223 (-) Transcript_88637:926-1594(-)
MLAQVRVGHDKIDLEGHARRDDLAPARHRATLDEAQVIADVEQFLPPGVEAHGHAVEHLGEASLGRILQIEDAHRRDAGHVRQQRSFQHRREALRDLSKVGLLIVHFRLSQVLAVQLPLLHWNAGFRHHQVQQVHVGLKVRLHRVAVGHDAAQAADDVRPKNPAEQHAQDANHVLLVAHRRDVAVADRGDSHHRPVQRGDVQVPRLARVVRLGAALEQLRHP